MIDHELQCSKSLFTYPDKRNCKYLWTIGKGHWNCLFYELDLQTLEGLWDHFPGPLAPLRQGELLLPLFLSTPLLASQRVYYAICHLLSQLLSVYFHHESFSKTLFELQLKHGKAEVVLFLALIESLHSQIDCFLYLGLCLFCWSLGIHIEWLQTLRGLAIHCTV